MHFGKISLGRVEREGRELSEEAGLELLGIDAEVPPRGAGSGCVCIGILGSFPCLPFLPFSSSSFTDFKDSQRIILVPCVLLGNGTWSSFCPAGGVSLCFGADLSLLLVLSRWKTALKGYQAVVKEHLYPL